MPPDRNKGNIEDDSNLAQCPWCPFRGHRQGMGAHKRFCPGKQDNINNNLHAREQIALNTLFEREHQAEAAAIQAAASNTSQGIEIPVNDQLEAILDAQPDFDMEDARPGNDNEALDNANINPNDPMEDATDEHQLNDILIQQHPHSGNPDAIYSFDVYYGNNESDTSSVDSDSDVEVPVQESPDEQPWRAFRTRLNFELAEVMQSAHLNRDEIERVIAIVKRAIEQPKEFTLTGYTDLSNAWTIARQTETNGAFEKSVISVPYGSGDVEDILSYDVWSRSVWVWCQELLLNRNLASQFKWNAERIFKFNGENFERFIDEPWTADAWWTYQSTLPSGASPFFIILYADKTRLSSFGTEKGYPVLVRCANLPVEIRNSTGIGGGHLVGWLPIPVESPAENRRKEYVNLKRIVWHKAMEIVVKDILALAKLGSRIKCADGVVRTIYPHILMMSADYEEQTMMALIRGTNSLKPCPNCLVPGDQMSVIPATHTRRTTETMRQAFVEAQTLNLGGKEELLKSYGLRDTENIFWNIAGTDVYNALSFDVLHAYDAGLFKVHLLEEAKGLIDKMGLDAERKVEAALQEMPRWPGLNHFKNLNTGEMADGTKFEDISKLIIFATLHVFTADASPVGFHLLCLIRSYLELRMYASLTVHTESTLSRGELELTTFGEALDKYKKVNKGSVKNWDFPKIHTHTHMFYDIRQKGATRNYNTKPNEKANGPLKKFYQFRTNFKHVASQILKVNEMDIVSIIVRDKITRLDEANRTRQAAIADNELPLVEGQQTRRRRERKIIGTNHVQLGSARPSLTLQDVESKYGPSDVIYLLFRRRLGQFFSQLLNKRVLLPQTHEITPYQFIQVFYQSLVDMNTQRDILRVNPNFHNQERFDCALIEVNKKEKQFIFVKLLFIFGTRVEGKLYHVALVLPMDNPCLQRNRGRDRKLRITRLRPRARASTVFIDVEKIIRGAVLAKDGGSDAGEYLVNTFIDQDMWVRIHPENTLLVTHAPI